MNLFGKAKKAPEPKDSLQKLKEASALLEKREQYLEKKIDAEHAIAKKNAKTNKRVALMALKRKKAYQGQIEKLSQSRTTLETQMMALEDMKANSEILSAMREGAQAMKSVHGKMSIDKVDDTMDDIREQMDLANEISNAIAQPLGNDLLDDDELEAELEELQEETLDEELLATEPMTALPDVPTTEPVKQQVVKEDDEDELSKLMAEMS
eukprot:Clim_evm7s226 gene=Clim_evmTU7s226